MVSPENFQLENIKLNLGRQNCTTWAATLPLWALGLFVKGAQIFILYSISLPCLVCLHCFLCSFIHSFLPSSIAAPFLFSGGLNSLCSRTGIHLPSAAILVCTIMSHFIQCWIFYKTHRAPCILGTHSTKWTIFPDLYLCISYSKVLAKLCRWQR